MKATFLRYFREYVQRSLIITQFVELTQASVPSLVVKNFPTKFFIKLSVLVPRHTTLTTSAAEYWVDSRFWVKSSLHSGSYLLQFTSLLRQQRSHGNQSKVSITLLYLLALSSYLPKSFFALLQPQWLINNSFVLSVIEFKFGMKLPWHNKHQPNTSLLL